MAGAYDHGDTGSATGRTDPGFATSPHGSDDRVTMTGASSRRFVPKPLARQVVVVTGGTSGIGLATVYRLADKGATIFLIARNEEALRTVCDELRARGGRADYAVADVAERASVEAAADRAIASFGIIDTWVNVAGAFIYGRLDVVPVEDQRRLFDVTYWGIVHGTLIAAARMGHSRGGTIINVGSVLGEVAIPYQGAYCASKFAVKGFTEAFRREAIAARQNLSITLIKPAAINTPFTDHSRNYLGSPGTRNPPPAYDPQLVARAIEYSCETPVRDLTVGGVGGISVVVANRLAPRAMDWFAARIGRLTMTTKNLGDGSQHDNLYEPRDDLHLNSSLRPFTRRSSLALEAQLNPGATSAAVAVMGVFVLLFAEWFGRRQ